MRGAARTPARLFRAEAARENALEEEHFNMVDRKDRRGGREESGRRDAIPFFAVI